VRLLKLSFPLIVLFGLGGSLWGQGVTADSLFRYGNRLFDQERYENAIRVYEALLQEVEHPYLYYNLGNAYFRMGEIGKAVWAYEKGLQFKPRDKDLRFNLDIVKARVVDRITLPEGFFLVDLYGALKKQVTLYDLLLLGGILLATAMFLYFLSAFRFLPMKIGRRSMGLFLVLAVLIHGMALDKYWEITDLQEGVVVNPLVNVRSAPVEREEMVIFQVHEGLKVEITNQQPDWIEIILLDGKKGWVPVSAVWYL